MENLSKVIEPLLVIACLKVFGGGEWGAFKVHEAILLIGMRVALLGLERGLIWYSSQVSNAVHNRVFWQTVMFVISLASLLFIIVMMLKGTRFSIIPDQEKYGYSNLYLPLFGLGMMAQALMFISTQFLVSKGILQFNMLSRFLVMPIGIYGSALGLSFLNFGTIALPLGYFIGTTLAMLIAFTGAFLYVDNLKSAFTFNPIPPLKMLRFSVTLSFSEIAMATVARLDIYLLTTNFGLASVEVYTTIVMVINTLRTVRQSFDNILLTLYSRMAKAKDSIAAMVKVFQQSNAKILSINLPIFAILVAYGDFFLSWLIKSDQNLWEPLVIGLFFVLFTTPTAISQQWQVGLGKSWIVPIGQLLFLLTSFSINMLLIPKIGVTGGILATGIGQIVGGIPAVSLCFYQSKGAIFNRNFWHEISSNIIWFAWLLIHFLTNILWLEIILLIGLLYWLYVKKVKFNEIKLP